MRSLVRAGVIAAAVFASVVTASAYDLIYGPDGARVYWNSGQIPFTIRMAQTPLLQDGSNYASSVQAAMAAWNAQLANVQFAATIAGPGFAGDFDGVNEIAFDSKIYSNAPDGGEDFGANVLAVTLSYRGGQRPDGSYERAQSDILFNTAWTWNSYRGSLQAPEDIRRVAIHELGHVLGLDHPDQAGQSVTAIMNSTVSSIDALQADDLTGAQFLYGKAGGFSPPSLDSFANAYAFGSVTTTAVAASTSVGATKESGEPNHAPDEPGGASIWFKLTATSSGSLTATTAGSAFDTLLGVYTGSAVGSLTQLAANDDVDPGVVRTSTATISVTGGTTYYFAVDGWDGQWGNVQLNLSFTPSGSAPAILSQPSNTTVNIGESAAFTLSNSGTAPVSFAWQRLPAGSSSWVVLSDGGAYSGATTSRLQVTAALQSNGDQFRCVLSNEWGTVTSSPATLTVVQPNRAPTATLGLSAERAVGQSLTLTVTVGDPDGNFSYANLWVDTPTRGTFAIRADNSLLATTAFSSAHAVTALTGAVTRTFALTSLDGAGTYTFRLAAADVAGLRTDAAAQSITVVPATPASYVLPTDQLSLAIVAGINHLPVRLPVTRNPSVPATGFTATSDVAWVTPAFDETTSELVLNFATTGLVAATNNANIRLTRGSETVSLLVQAAVSPANITKLIDDPIRSRVYGVHQNGQNQGALVVFDPLSGTYLGSLSLDRKPGGIAVRANGAELVALCSVSKTIVAVDLATLRVTESIPLTTYDEWGADYTSGDIQYGPGTILYYTDGTWAPVLRVFNRATRAVLQSILLDAGGIDNSGRYGFGDFAVLPDFSAMYAWGQYGWSAGLAGSNIARLTIGTDGRITTSSLGSSYSYPTFNRDPLNTPVLLASNGDAFIKQMRVAAGTVSPPAQSFASDVFAISPGGEIAATKSGIYEVATGNLLYSLTGQPTVQVITSDYFRLVYFEPTTKQLRTINLYDAIGATIMGRNLSPANESIVLAPTVLQWTSQPGTDRYRVYLGTSATAVASANQASAEYLGEVNAPSITLPNPLTPGTVYYWRVDPVNEAGSAVGTVFNFRVATVASSQSKIDTATVVGHATHRVALDLTSATAGKSWSASSANSWIKFEPSSGTTPASLNVVFDASNLAAGVHQGAVTITASDGAFSVPVKLTVDALAITAMRSMPNSTKIYALSEENFSAYSGTSRAYLLEIDALMKRVTRVVRVGTSATDLAVHVPDNRVYVANWKTGALLAIDLGTFALARSYGFRPAQSMGYTEGDVYRLSAGVAGRLMVTEQDQWIGLNIFDTATGTSTANVSFLIFQGRGSYDPTGRYYYHGDSGYTGAVLHKWDTAGDQFSAHVTTGVSGIGYYGAADLFLSEDGSRIFWNGAVLRPDLTVEWDLKLGIVASSRDGRYIFTPSAVYDVQNRSLVGTLPRTANVSAFNAATGILAYQDGSAMGYYVLPAAAPTRTPIDGAILNSVTRLAWTGIPGATGYRVYLGTDATEVGAAGVGSPQFLGAVTAPELTLTTPLETGRQYFWRVDVLVGSDVASGAVQSFTLSAIAPGVPRVSGITVQGNPDFAFDVPLTTAAAGQAWSATTNSSWIRLSPSSGTTPATLRVSLDTTALAAGTYQSSVSITGGGSTFNLPVSVQVDALNVTILKSDPDSAKVYAISERTDENPSRAYLIEADSNTKKILRVVSAGSSVTDLAVHGPENRVYVTNWKNGTLLAFDRSSLAVMRSYPFLPFSYSGGGGSDVYRVAAGVAGRLVVEEYDQWIDIAIYNTTSGTLLGKAFVREGGGQFEPNGRYYFHGENNSSGAKILKFDVAGDVFSQIASNRTESASYYGSRTVVMSQDGSRVFWNGGVFDNSLGLLWNTGPEVYSASADGRYAFGETRIYDTVAKSTAYLMPVTTRVSTFNSTTGRLVVPQGGALGFFSLSELSSFVPPTLRSQPATITVAANSQASFSVVVDSNSQSVTYQWQRLPGGTLTWSNLYNYDSGFSGVNSATLTLINRTALANSGDRYRCIVTNAAGSVTSADATLYVATEPAPLQAAHGYHHSAFLRWGGAVSAVGRNQEGQLGDGTNFDRASLVASLTGTIALTSGADHLLYLRQDGTLLASGYNEFGTLGTGSTANVSTPVQIATGVAAASGGYRHTLVRKTNGTLWATGSNSNGQLGLGDIAQRNSFVQVASNVISASAGYLHSLYVTGDRQAYAMGWNALGQLGDGTTTDRRSPVLIGSGYIAAAAGYYHSLLLKADGTLWAVGLNNFGQLGDGTTVNRTSPVQIDSSVVAMAAGFAHSVYLKANGTVWAVGRNEYGELGNGTLTSVSTPVQIASDAAEVTAGVHSIGVVKTDGSLWVSGLNDTRQLYSANNSNVITLRQQASGGNGLPSAQPTVSATYSVSADRVTLTWGHVANATSYRVLRSQTNDASSASVVAARVVGNFYQDPTGQPGVPYYYWVQSMNASGALNPGVAAQGLYGVPLIPPSITFLSSSRTVSIGESTAFTVVAEGTAPLSYRWRKGIADIPGANTARLSINSATLADAGDYSVVVSNVAGSVTSSTVTLTVNRFSQSITFEALTDRVFPAASIPLTATASSGLPVSFTVLSGPATLEGNNLAMTGSGVVTVRASQPGDDTYAPAAPVDRSFVVGTTVAAWAAAQFSVEELNDTSISGPNADPDGDGLSNLLEYALGLSPRAGSAPPMELAATTSEWSYTFTRPADRTDLTYVVECSPDLANWSSLDVTLTRVSTVDGVETWRATTARAPGASCFLRLRVTR